MKKKWMVFGAAGVLSLALGISAFASGYAGQHGTYGHYAGRMAGHHVCPDVCTARMVSCDGVCDNSQNCGYGNGECGNGYGGGNGCGNGYGGGNGCGYGGNNGYGDGNGNGYGGGHHSEGHGRGGHHW